MTNKEIAKHFYAAMDEKERTYVKDIPHPQFMSIFNETIGKTIQYVYELESSKHIDEILIEIWHLCSTTS